MILCCGEALVDMLPRETTEGGTAFAPHAGGAVFNTAIALGRLGAPSGYFGGLSNDLFGNLLVETLEGSNVDASLCPRSDRPTTLAFVELINGNAKYAFYDENTAGRMLAKTDLPELDAEIEALFFGGISLVSEPQADSYAQMCTSDDTRLVMIDPNVRPGFITDADRYRTRLAPMLQRADVVKVSDEDMEWLQTDPTALLEGGAAVVLLTKGEDGVEVLTRTQSIQVAAEKAEVVDTVGAGDTFNAGFLAGLKRAGFLSRDSVKTASKDVLVDAATLGAKVAAITVSRAGANPPWDHEL